MKERANSIYVRVTEKEKIRIKNKADKCGLTISEYLRKRALGYSPKALLPESFYEFSGKLSDLYEQIDKGYSTELEERILSLIDEIQLKLLTPERKDETPGSPQSLLCGEKEQPRNNELFGTCAENE